MGVSATHHLQVGVSAAHHLQVGASATHHLQMGTSATHYLQVGGSATHHLQVRYCSGSGFRLHKLNSGDLSINQSVLLCTDNSFESYIRDTQD